MIRSILVALDDTEESHTARQFAIKMAKRRKAKLTGIGILDQPWLTAPEAVPIGGAAFKAELDQQLVEDAKKQLHKIERDFRKDCEKEKLDFDVIDTTGIPTHEISRHLVNHDILVVGKDTDFHFMGTHGMSGIVKELLNMNPRPLILTGNQSDAGKDIVIAYDGSLAASKAIHLAILLNLFKFTTPHLVTVASSKKEAKEIMKLAVDLFERHKTKVEIHPIESTGKPSAEILTLADTLHTSMIVLGTCGHRGIQSLFTGSCMKDLLTSNQYPYFIYH